MWFVTRFDVTDLIMWTLGSTIVFPYQQINMSGMVIKNPRHSYVRLYRMWRACYGCASRTSALEGT
jgi:hypothetical protein